MKMKLTFPKVKKGGPGSGDFGHTGRPGQIGGSSSGGGGSSSESGSSGGSISNMSVKNAVHVDRKFGELISGMEYVHKSGRNQTAVISKLFATRFNRIKSMMENYNLSINEMASGKWGDFYRNSSSRNMDPADKKYIARFFDDMDKDTQKFMN